MRLTTQLGWPSIIPADWLDRRLSLLSLLQTLALLSVFYVLSLALLPPLFLPILLALALLSVLNAPPSVASTLLTSLHPPLMLSALVIVSSLNLFVPLSAHPILPPLFALLSLSELSSAISSLPSSSTSDLDFISFPLLKHLPSDFLPFLLSFFTAASLLLSSPLNGKNRQSSPFLNLTNLLILLLPPT